MVIITQSDIIEYIDKYVSLIMRMYPSQKMLKYVNAIFDECNDKIGANDIEVKLKNSETFLHFATKIFDDQSEYSNDIFALDLFPNFIIELGRIYYSKKIYKLGRKLFDLIHLSKLFQVNLI